MNTKTGMFKFLNGFVLLIMNGIYTRHFGKRFYRMTGGKKSKNYP